MNPGLQTVQLLGVEQLAQLAVEQLMQLLPSADGELELTAALDLPGEELAYKLGLAVLPQLTH